MALAHLEKREIIFIAIVVFVFIGGLWFYKDKTFVDVIYAPDRSVAAVNKKNIIKKQSQEAKRQEQAYYKNFENSLNAFLKNVATQMSDYRKNRTVIESALNPQSLRTPQYIEENYQLAKAAIPD